MRRLHLARSYRNAVMALGPVGYWRLGESAGTVAKDETGANDGTYVGSPTLGVAGLLSGDPNTAVTFAASKLVTLAGVTVNDFTLAGWIVLNDGTSVVHLLEFGNGADRFFGLNVEPDLARLHAFTMTASGYLDQFGPVGTVPAGAVHVAMVRSGVSVWLYVNGVQSGATMTSKDGQMITTGGHLGSGVNDVDGCTGTIDEAAIWNRALTAAEIARLYQVGRGF